MVVLLFGLGYNKLDKLSTFFIKIKEYEGNKIKSL